MIFGRMSVKGPAETGKAEIDNSFTGNPRALMTFTKIVPITSVSALATREEDLPTVAWSEATLDRLEVSTIVRCSPSIRLVVEGTNLFMVGMS
jgi:hypothetical protein